MKKFFFFIHQEILQKRRFFAFATFGMVLIFFLSLAFSRDLIGMLYRARMAKLAATVSASLQEELAHLSTHAEQLALSETLLTHIRNKDILNTLSFLDDTKAEHVGMLFVTDADGVVLARTEIVSQRGDNIFLSTPWGQQVRHNGQGTWVGAGKTLPFIMNAGRLIMQDGAVAGSVFAGNQMSEDYARKLRNELLPLGAHIAFYTYKEGVTGTTIDDISADRLLRAYLSGRFDEIEANVLNEEPLDKEVFFGGSHYFVKNIILGVPEEAAGMLVFIPVSHSAQAAIFTVVITLLFIGIGLSIYDRSLDGKTHHHYAFLAGSSLVLFLAVFSATIYRLDAHSLILQKPPFVIYNSIIKFDPEFDVIDRFFEKRVALKVYTGGEAINAAQARVEYDPAMIRVVDVVTSRSFCDPAMFIEKDVDNERGRVSISCGLPTPGFSERQGIIAELVLQPLRIGEFSLRFGDDTLVLANDGLGTNVLREAAGGSYRIIDYKMMASGMQTPLPIYSFSHPNNQRWYRDKELHVAWPYEQGSMYWYALNKASDFTPVREHGTKEDVLALQIEEDGVYYFHLAQEKNGRMGPVSHFKVMIDTVSPAPPGVTVSADTAMVGDVIRFNFESSDALSGVQRGFYIKINNGVFLPVGSSLHVPFLMKGRYDIVLRAFDNAGNFSENATTVMVAK